MVPVLTRDEKSPRFTEQPDNMLSVPLFVKIPWGLFVLSSKMEFAIKYTVAPDDIANEEL